MGYIIYLFLLMNNIKNNHRYIIIILIIRNMLAKLSALTLVVIPYVNGQEQTFLSKSKNFEIYKPQL